MSGESSDPVREVAPVPFRLRVGVTGHRRLDPAQHAEVTAAITAVLRGLLTPDSAGGRLEAVVDALAERDRGPRTPVHLTLISALAEGADRLAVHAARALGDDGFELEAPLPFPVEDYEQDFRDPNRSDRENAASLAEFRDLLGSARSSTVLGKRSDGYRPVGWYIVDRADVVIAIWNGHDNHKEGGTADIVRRATESDVPVVWIPARTLRDDGTVEEDPGAGPAGWCVYLPPVPFRLRVGITGHPHLDPAQHEAIQHVVAEALHGLVDVVTAGKRQTRTPVHVTLVSALGEGADRLAVHTANDMEARGELEGFRLEAPLPFPKDDYEKDFEQAQRSTEENSASLDEFRSLYDQRDRSRSDVVLGDRSAGADDSDDYRPVGWYIVDRADVLIAMWNGIDGGRGEPADIVRRALECDVAVIWIPVRARESGKWRGSDFEPGDWCVLDRWEPEMHTSGERLDERLDKGAAFESTRKELQAEYERTASLNERLRDPRAFSGILTETKARFRRMRNRIVPRPPEAEDENAWVEAWVRPYSKAAGSLAGEYQAPFRVGLGLLFFLAAAAAIAIATQTVLTGYRWVEHEPLWEHEVPWLGAMEVAALLALGGAVVWMRWREWHERYIAFRFLDERFRTLPYLKLARASILAMEPTVLGDDILVHRSERWPWRIAEEVWARKPAPPERPVSEIRELIADRWVRDPRTDFRRDTSLGPPWKNTRAYRQKLATLSEVSASDERPDGPPCREHVPNGATRRRNLPPTPMCQFSYHQRAFCRDELRHRWLSRIARVLFLVTLGAACVHLVMEIARKRDEPLARAALLGSIAFAAIAAATSAWLEQRGRHQQAVRSRHMMTVLAVDDQQIRNALTDEQLRERVERTHRHMLAENRLWFENVVFEDVDLHL